LIKASVNKQLIIKKMIQLLTKADIYLSIVFLKNYQIKNLWKYDLLDG